MLVVDVKMEKKMFFYPKRLSYYDSLNKTINYFFRVAFSVLKTGGEQPGDIWGRTSNQTHKKKACMI